MSISANSHLSYFRFLGLLCVSVSSLWVKVLDNTHPRDTESPQRHRAKLPERSLLVASLPVFFATPNKQESPVEEPSECEITRAR